LLQLTPDFRAVSKVTVEQRAEEWLATEAKARLKDSTFVGYEHSLKIHINPRLGHVPFSKLVRKDVIALIGELKDSGLSRATIKSIIAPLRAMYFDAITDGETGAEPPAQQPEKPPQQPGQPPGM
jgi:site-specific recombinase XerD